MPPSTRIIPALLLPNGAAGQVLQTDAFDNILWADVSASSITPGAPNTFLKTVVGVASWSTIGLSDIPAGAPNQYLLTDGAGIVGWGPAASLLSPLAQMGPPQFTTLTEHNVAEVRGPTLPANGSYTCLDIDGAGYISRVFMTIKQVDDTAIRQSRLQIFVDGEVSPSVDVQFQDLCCFRGPNAATYPATVTTTKFTASRVDPALGSSFSFNLVAPFSTHIKVVIVNGGATIATLGGHIDYELGNDLVWGPYKKLHCLALPGTSYPALSVQTLLDVTLPNGGLYAGMYLFFNGGDGVPAYSEARMQFYLDGSATPINYDSTEDYFGFGWYFNAGVQTDETSGCTYLNTDKVGTYRWHDRDPIQFASRLQVVWTVGQLLPVPTINPVTVNGVIWYYEADAGASVTPALIKGDTGPAGATGAPGALARDPIGQHDTTGAPIVLYQGANNTDSSGNNYHLTTLDAGVQCVQLGRGSNTIKGMHFPTYAAAALRALRTPALDINGDITIAFMIRPLAVPVGALNYGVVVDYADTARNTLATMSLYTVMFSGNCRLRFQWMYDSTLIQNCDLISDALYVGEISHYVVTRSGVEPNIVGNCYKNGVLVATNTVPRAPNGVGFSQRLQIGNQFGSATTDYELKNGIVSSLCIFDYDVGPVAARALAERCLELIPP